MNPLTYLALLEVTSLEEYINRYQVDGVLWKAERLLSHEPNMLVRNDNVRQIATMLAHIPETERVLRDDYVKKISKLHDLVPATLNKFIADVHATTDKKKKAKEKKKGKKNIIPKLEGDPKVFRFFNEICKTDRDGSVTGLDKLKFDKYKFTQLLKHYGYSRFETDAVGPQQMGKEYSFVQLSDNVIKSVTIEQIKDFVEDFIKNDYNFEGAKYDFADALTLVNTFYDQMKTMGGKDLLTRLRTDNPLIINTDTHNSTFLYYKNGFTEVTKDNVTVHSYEKMNGSVWEHQMLDRKFTPMDIKNHTLEQFGLYADFCFKIAGEDENRFMDLCSIIGYNMHDFYEYKLKATLFTDSTISETSEGRTGKTLITKMLSNVRSYCEINGKEFDATARDKYQTADLSTQVMHLNDVKHVGRFKFYFQDVFNDITEGYIVKKLYMPVFRKMSKFIISTNKTLNIQGASERDRINEFEVSSFFGEHRSPENHYNCWFPTPNGKRRDWDEKEFNRFDNFMCFCSQMFHTHGLRKPEAINLGERKLMNHTHADFLDFIDDITISLKSIGMPWPGYADTMGQTGFVASCELHEFEFDKKKLYERIVHEKPDLKKFLTMHTLHKWLKQFGELRYNATPAERKSNGAAYIKFIKGEKKA